MQVIVVIFSEISAYKPLGKCLYRRNFATILMIPKDSP